MYTLELEGGGETKISCPVLSFAEPKPTKCQANVSTAKPLNCLALDIWGSKQNKGGGLIYTE